MQISSQIFDNAKMGILSKTLEAITAFVTIPIVIKALGQDKYGLWISIGQALVLFSAMDFGITNSIGRYIAKYRGRKDYLGILQTIKSSFLLLLIASGLVLLLTLIITLNDGLFLPAFLLSNSESILVIWILSIGVSVDLLLRIGRGIISGHHRFDILYTTKIAGQVFRFICIVYVYKVMAIDSITSIAIITMVAIIIPDSIMMYIGLRTIKADGYIIHNKISMNHIYELLSLGLSSVINSSLISLSKSGSLLIIGSYLSLSFVTLYSIPASIIIYPSMFLNTFLMSFTTMSAELESTGKSSRIRNMHTYGIKYSLAVNTIILMGALLFGYDFLVLWMGDVFLVSDYIIMNQVLVLLIVSYLLEKINNPTSRILNGTGKHWIVTAISAQMSILGVIIGYVIMVNSDYGVRAIALGWLVSSTITTTIVYPIVIINLKLLNLKELLYKLLPIPLLYTPLYLVINYVIRDYVFSNWHTLAIGIIIFGAVSSILLYMFFIENNHKILIKDKIMIWKR